jgi:hypothetical protein
VKLSYCSRSARPIPTCAALFTNSRCFFTRGCILRNTIRSARFLTYPHLPSPPASGGGHFDSDNPTFSGLIGDSVEAIVLYIDTATAGGTAISIHSSRGMGTRDPKALYVECQFNM